MGRRRLVVLVSALLMLAIGGGLIAAFVSATQSVDGRDWIRRVAQGQLSRTGRGTFHLGTLSGSFLTDLRLDSLEIRDPDDSVFVATGPVHVTFDPRDLLDGRLFIRSVEIARPTVALRRDFTKVWAHDRIWPRRDGPRRALSRSAFGSVIVLERVAMRGGHVSVTEPWAPADSLRGAARDSAITVALANPRQETRRVGAGRFTRTRRWREISLDIPRARLAYPDSAGRHIAIARFDAIESDPPFAFHNLRGEVRLVGDSVWFDVSRFALPGSAGSANGKVWWGKDDPMHYRIHVEGDTVALADVAWIAPSLPTVGGGRMTLDIRDARGVPNGFEYALTRMDVRSHASRLRGKMTWVIGGPVAVLRDVDLEATPLDFQLIERFSQGPLPYPFAGTFRGRMRARGGPLNRFVIDDVAMTFRDGNVEGSEARVSGQGELDILDPGHTVFRGFTLALADFDLRTPQALTPDFPRLGGVLAGSARLDSSWLDVRFSEANLTHVDGDAGESRFRGGGRVTSGGEAMSYDVALEAMPLSFTAMARSFPSIPLRGDFSGPFRARGTLNDLLLVADLSGEAGRLEADVRLDAEAPGYFLSGRAAVTAFDPRSAVEDARMPSGELTARATFGLAGDSVANLEGSAQVTFDRSTLGGVRVFAGNAQMRFTDGLARLDTLHLETTAIELNAGGALGLHAGRPGEMRFAARVDSLGGLRRWLASSASDSLAGGIRLKGTARGWLRDFGLDATLEGEGLLARGSSVRQLSGVAALTRLPEVPTGAFTLTADTVRVSGFSLTRATARATLDSSGAADLVVRLNRAGSTEAALDARIARSDGTLRLELDSISLQTSRQRWRLATPASVASGPSGFLLDSIVLLGSMGSSFRFAGAMPREGAIDLALSAVAVPVSDLAELLQVSGTPEGRVDFDARLQGTRAAPSLEASAILRDGLLAGIRLDTLIAKATATADALRFTSTLGPSARPALRAEGTLPLRLALDGDGPSFAAEGPLHATVRSDTVNLRLFETLTRHANGNAGAFALNLDVGGTWRRPTFEGGLVVRDGSIAFAQLGNVRWRNVSADIGLHGDSIAIRRLTATSSSAGRNGRASIGGWVTMADRTNPSFDLSLRTSTFHIYNVPNVADIDLSDSLRINGSLRGATLRGALTADRAIISIPEIATKDVIALEQFDPFGIVDTASLFDQRLLPRRPTEFEQNLTVRNVPVRMGRDVWLRSAEANINLGGAVSITRGRVTRGREAGDAQLALTGALQTVRGTYRLNLGPVQRTFEVESGTIQFFGDPDPTTGALDISALHTVRQYSKQGSQPDVRVRVRLGGSIMAPTAELSTPDSARVKNADLISYLVTGGPSFDIAGRGADYYTSTAARVLISSLGSVVGGKAAGGLCDDARLSTSGVDEGERGLRNVGSSILSGTRFNCAKQVGDKTFVRLDAGLCQVGQLVGSGGGSALAFANAIGVKLDYLLSPGLTMSAGVEPPTSAVLCSQSVNARGFVPTPQQFGFDLFRAWRF